MVFLVNGSIKKKGGDTVQKKASIAPATTTPASTTTKETAKPAQNQKQGGLFGMFKKQPKQKIDRSKIRISKPENYQHVSHIGFTAGSGFELRNS